MTIIRSTIRNDKAVNVVLIVPPFCACDMPSIASSILKSSLEKKNISCKVCYANMFLAKMIGLKQYNKIMGYNMDELICERLFATSAYNNIEPTILKEIYVPNYLKSFHRHLDIFYDGIDNAPRELLSQSEYFDIEAQCKTFLEKIAVEISLLQPIIIGFSSKFQQINSSVAMARMIKKILPDTIVVIGGNNCDGVMGEELSSSIDIFDYVFQGEADIEFADFCQKYINDRVLPEKKLIRCTIKHNLNEIPSPDYTDYFEQVPLVQNNENVWLPFESSRGCWWGQKNQCRFCGINSLNIKYRTKSPNQVVTELCHFQKKYPGISNFIATDAIFPQTDFRQLCQKLLDSNFHGKIYYEIKANLTFEHLSVMKKAGILIINPGIESLSTRLLRLMNKGNTATTNIRLLRDCRELDITPLWNLLVGIPGDRVSDYEEQSRIFPFLQHLQPPSLIPITIQRFSPYFDDANKYLITEIKPLNAYKYAFPRSMNIDQIAYYFYAKYPSESRNRPEILESLIQQLLIWHKSWKDKPWPHLLIKRLHPNEWIVEDSRDCAAETIATLEVEEYSILHQCRIPKSRAHIKDNNRIGRLLDLRYLIEIDGKLLSLVCDSSIHRETEMKTIL